MSRIGQWFNNKWLFLALGFILGVVATLSLQAIRASGNPSEDRVAATQAQPIDPFEAIRKEMMAQLADTGVGGQPHGDEIQTREDDKYLYYDLAVEGLNQEKLSINVHHQQMEIIGQVENKDENGNFFSSSFQRSFPLPSNVDSERVQVENGKGKVVIKIPKRG